MPDDIYKYIEGNNNHRIIYEKCETERRCAKKIKKKQKLFTITIHSSVKCQINQPERPNTNFCELEAICDNSCDIANSSY